MDIRQSSFYQKYMQSLGWMVEKAGEANIFVRHFPIFSHWAVIKVQRPEKVDFGELDKIARKHHALFVKIEPNQTLSNLSGLGKLGFNLDNWPLLPSKTLILDLKKTTLESLPKDTRYEIRKAEEKGVVVEKSEDIEVFYRLLEETMKIGKWNVPIHREVVALWKSFQPNNSILLLPRQGMDVLGGCLIVWQGERAHYMYAALTRQGRANSAAYLTLFEAVKFLKQMGVTYLDLEGILDQRYPSLTKNWQGFTKFKMGWGGTVQEFPGAFTRYYNPFIKLLFSMGDMV